MQFMTDATIGNTAAVHNTGMVYQSDIATSKKAAGNPWECLAALGFPVATTPEEVGTKFDFLLDRPINSKGRGGGNIFKKKDLGEYFVHFHVI